VLCRTYDHGRVPHPSRGIRDTYQRVAAREGNKVARVAAARKLLTLVFYGLRDGEIRCLQQKAA
jgi:hypothetical protein